MLIKMIKQYKQTFQGGKGWGQTLNDNCAKVTEGKRERERESKRKNKANSNHGIVM